MRIGPRFLGRGRLSAEARADRRVEAFRFDDDRGQPCLRASLVEFALLPLDGGTSRDFSRCGP
jgi:hypothetical protein